MFDVNSLIKIFITSDKGGGKCALPSAVLVNLLSCFSCLEFEGDGQNMSITVKLEAWTFEAYAIKIVPKAPRGDRQR